MTTGADIIAEARRWIGTRWAHQTGIRGVATDCLGLIAGVGMALGLPGSERWRADERMRNYTRAPNARLLLAACADYLDRIELEALEAGCILLMRFEEGPQHFALLSNLRPGRIIHAFAGAGRVVENSIDATWAERIVRAYRYRGLA